MKELEEKKREKNDEVSYRTGGERKKSAKSANDDDARSFRGHASAIRRAMMRSTVSSIGCWPRLWHDVFVTCV